jgi:chemotaxis protein methyltransferase CheR
MMNATLELTPALFSELRVLAYRKCGIYLADNKASRVEALVAKRVAALALRDAGAYVAFLSRDPRGAQDLAALLQEIERGEPGFFQPEAQMEMVRASLLPAAFAARQADGAKRLRLWSVACSSGEEPYSLAILLREALSARDTDWEVSVTACDVSPRMVELVRAGWYAEDTLRCVPPALRIKHFKPVPGGLFELAVDVKSLVHVECAALLDKALLSRVADIDIVLCRNVLVSLDSAARRRAMESLHAALRDGGYLIVGAGESLHGLSEGFKLVHHNRAVVYQKI